MANKVPIAGCQSEPPLLLLPDLADPCLVAVLACCADDLPSLFSAARAHSRLRHAAALALRSITVVVTSQEQADSLLLYLTNHGQHVHSVSIKGAEGNAVTLRQFPPNLQLKSLRLECLRLQLQPVGGLGVLGPALKQLQLFSCKLFGDDEKLAGVLSHLPGQEHLSIVCTYQNNKGKTTGVRCPTSMFQQMPQLTHLMLFGAELLAPDDNSPVPQQQVLTRLVDLQLASTGHERSPSVTASMLSGASQMTRLGLTRCSFEVGALAGKSNLLHLDLQSCSIFDVSDAEVRAHAQLLSYLQHLPQLKHLGLAGCFEAADVANIPAAAFSALTTSSELQRLNLSNCTLPADVWQHLFPAGRQLPHLTLLSITRVKQPADSVARCPEGSRLVSCCPGLRSLDMQFLQYSSERLRQLQGLSGLQTLRLATHGAVAEGVEAVSQLTGLQELCLSVPNIAGLLLQLTHLQQLTKLDYDGPGMGGVRYIKLCLSAQEPGDAPVWRQLLKLHNGHE